MLKLIMGVSADGFVAKGPKDDMTWLGPWDKKAFRMLTLVGGICGVGSKTRPLMPEVLPGRTIFTLSTRHVSGAMTLERFARLHPGAWLLGGQSIAVRALSESLVGEVHLCRSERRIEAGIPDLVTIYLKDRGWQRAPPVKLGDTSVECWRRG
jgi:dihydrofolate reductase